ncbi:MAG: redoxin domain-containing protein [Actinobacteria bacterium]|nr:redoxin domain-containing protein [Actinomycetota bacterium]
MSDAPVTEAPAEQPAKPRRLAPVISLVVAAVLGALFWVLASSASGPTDESGVIESPLLGRPAPALRSTTLDEEPFDLARRKGSWVVLNFFNSTCAPCRAEHPALVEFTEQQASFGDEGAELYTVLQYLDDVNNVKAFFLNRGGDWPIVRDDDGTINVAFGVAQVPETFIINPNGEVVVRWAGQIDANTLSQLVQQQRDLFGAT